MEVWRQPLRLQADSYSRLGLTIPRIFLWNHAYTLNPGQPSPGRSSLLRPPIAITSGTGILTSFPSSTLLKPRLRGRLTLRGTALRRKPWVFGEQVSHLFYRYSCQHCHFRYLHHSSRCGFTGLRNAPLPELNQRFNNSQLRCKF